MAKGQMKSNKETRKPKADKKAKGAAEPANASKASSTFKPIGEKKK